MRIQLFAFGGLTVQVDGREIVSLGSQPVRASLLGYLAVDWTGERWA